MQGGRLHRRGWNTPSDGVAFHGVAVHPARNRVDSVYLSTRSCGWPQRIESAQIAAAAVAIC
jgi:hypothetical protein